MIKILFATLLLFSAPAFAQANPKDKGCSAMDRPCLLREIETLSADIDKQEWKDQTLRDLAKTYTYEGQPDRAIALIDKIESADTKAMTIRAIGMAAAAGKWDKARYDKLFSLLAEKASQINHPPSQGIAYTYITMAQAFAGLDDDARKMASTMQNAALRNKAIGETAEIEADRGDLKNALITMGAMDVPSFRNKEYDILSRIFLDKAMVNEAYVCASKIDNAYLKAKSIQRILNKGNVEQEDNEPKEDLARGTPE